MVGNIIGGLIIILIAVFVIALRKEFVKGVVKTNNSGLGLHRYGKKEEKAGEWIVILVCSIAIFFGVLRMLGFLS